jgi:hypothetical protein
VYTAVPGYSRLGLLLTGFLRFSEKIKISVAISHRCCTRPARTYLISKNTYPVEMLPPLYTKPSSRPVHFPPVPALHQLRGHAFKRDCHWSHNFIIPRARGRHARAHHATWPVSLKRHRMALLGHFEPRCPFGY